MRVCLLLAGMLSLSPTARADSSPVTVQARIRLIGESQAESKSEPRPEARRESRRKHAALTATRAILWLTPADRQQAQAVLPTPRSYTMVQQGKSFSPHMLIIPVGSTVAFPNKDPFFHNVFSLFNGRRFDLGLYQSGQSRSVAFNRLGVSYLFCNIHPEMSAVILTLDTPYYALSDENGNIALPNIPEGSYTLHVWSEASSPEALKALTRTVTITTATADLGPIEIHASTSQLADHLNKFGEPYDPHATESANPY